MSTHYRGLLSARPHHVGCATVRNRKVVTESTENWGEIDCQGCLLTAIRCVDTRAGGWQVFRLLPTTALIERSHGGRVLVAYDPRKGWHFEYPMTGDHADVETSRRDFARVARRVFDLERKARTS